ncbi:hypothetical protein C7S13_0365 [Burkholderia cepacia]|nr:hypothetical protein [Burkholderia cepacia]
MALADRSRPLLTIRCQQAAITLQSRRNATLVSAPNPNNNATRSAS